MTIPTHTEASVTTGIIITGSLGLDKTYQEAHHTTAMLVIRTSNKTHQVNTNLTCTKTNLLPIQNPKMKERREKVTWGLTSMQITTGKERVMTPRSHKTKHRYMLLIVDCVSNRPFCVLRSSFSLISLIIYRDAV